MNRTRYLKGECGHCGGHIEFPAESVGMTIDCPHCGQPTELLLAVPPEEPSVSRKTIIWTIIAILILGLGMAGLFVAFKWAERRAAILKPPAPTPAPATNAAPAEPEDPATLAHFRISAITLEKTPGSTLVYAVGTLVNPSAKKRFGVRIELDVLDANGEKVGTSKEYQSVMEPQSEWRFKALVVASKAAAVKLASIREDP